MAFRHQNIGIKAVEIYFPNQLCYFLQCNKCVDQADLEKFDGVSPGKYTIGLGQTRMGFCDDREDIYSFALTVTSNLLAKNKIDPNSIGRLEVGTETILDKSKSVKTVLMQLFGENTNIEGADTTNACYGGTNALFNTLNWVESSGWDGRDGIVVAGDIATYSKGPARPSGGAGIIALLIGPDAPLVIEPGLRGSYMKHTYDFYKPDSTTEYPIVDGHYSIKCYTEALDACYKAYNKREESICRYTEELTNGKASHSKSSAKSSTPVRSITPLDRFDFIVFHSPTCKLVMKSYARLLYGDYLVDPTPSIFTNVPSAIRDLEYDQSLSNRDIEKTFMELTKQNFKERVQPSLDVSTMCGNLYCGSVYGSLLSLLSNVDSSMLQGKRVGIFSHGGGLTSSFFSLRVLGQTDHIQRSLDLKKRLAARLTVTPIIYDEACITREKVYGKKNYTPSGNVETIASGAYYLESVDDMFQRKYAIKA